MYGAASTEGADFAGVGKCCFNAEFPGRRPMVSQMRLRCQCCRCALDNISGRIPDW